MQRAIEELAAGSQQAIVGGHVVRVSSKEHLLRAKRADQPPRRIDLPDIEDLEELINREREVG